MGLGETIGTTVGGIIGARNARRSADQDRKRRMKMLEGMNFEPQYTSDRAPTYQRSQSPVARAYLESLLTGTNPDATFSGSPNAALTKRDQQGAQNRMYGSPEQRQQMQEDYFAKTPWAVTAPNQPVGGGPPTDGKGPQQPGAGRVVADPDDTFAMKYPFLAQSGMTPEMMEKIAGDGKSRRDLYTFTPDNWADETGFRKGSNISDESMSKFVDMYQSDPEAAWKYWKKSGMGHYNGTIG